MFCVLAFEVNAICERTYPISPTMWIIFAAFLYLELFVLIMFLMPYSSDKIWDRMSRCPIFLWYNSLSNMYHPFLAWILLLVLFDTKYKAIKHFTPHQTDNQHKSNNEILLDIRMFRAKCNFYLYCVGLLMSIIIKRFIVLMTKQSSIMALSQASLEQSEKAINMAQLMMKQKNRNELNMMKTLSKEMESFRTERKALRRLSRKLELMRADREAIKMRSMLVTDQYSELVNKFENLLKWNKRGILIYRRDDGVLVREDLEEIREIDDIEDE